VFIKAIQLLESEGKIISAAQQTAVEAFVKSAREAFFCELVDISQFRNLMELAEKHSLPSELIEEKVYSGEAHAALDLDRQLENNFNIAGSPTLVFNEGRQLLYGNVGYRVIEANVRELIHQPASQASWC
jgi:predicted DsbA family dithiol-disulfide isomerase